MEKHRVVVVSNVAPVAPVRATERRVASVPAIAAVNGSASARKQQTPPLPRSTQ